MTSFYGILRKTDAKLPKNASSLDPFTWLDLERGNTTEEIPMISLSTDVQIIDFAAQIEIRQEFVNLSNQPIEVIFDFPLDKNATVISFWAKSENTHLVSSIEPLSDAKNRYDNAISSGHSSYLIEEATSGSGFFTLNLGNLPPCQTIEIGVAYVTELLVRDSACHLLLPVLPAAAFTGEGAQFSITIQFSQLEICNLQCSTHNLKTLIDAKKRKAQIELEANSNFGEKSFDLEIEFQKTGDGCQVTMESHPEINSQALMINFSSGASLSSVNSEVIFILDRSGSMAGSRIESVKSAMELFLCSLPESVLFNIIGFGNSFNTLFKLSQPVNEHNLESAFSYTRGMSADMGGTEVLPVFEELFKTPVPKGLSRVIFFLTDGDVSNKDQVIQLVRENNLNQRIYTVGIGSSVNRNLVEGVAHASCGTAAFINGVEGIDFVVMESLTASMQPALINATFKIEEPCCQKFEFFTPQNFPSTLLLDERIMCYAVLKPDVQPLISDTVSISISGQYLDQSVTLAKKFTFGEVARTQGRQIHSLAVHSLIREYERGSVKLNENRILDLSIKFEVLCKSTAMVVLDPRSVSTTDSMALRKVSFGRPKNDKVIYINNQPVYPSGISHSKTGKHGSAKMHITGTDSTGKKVEYIVPSSQVTGYNNNNHTSTKFNNNNNSQSTFKRPNVDSDALQGEGLRAFLTCIKANGCFAKTVLGHLPGPPIDLAHYQDMHVPEEVLVSAIAVAFLETKCPAQKILWTLGVSKARRFIGNDTLIQEIKQKTFLGGD